MTEEYRPTEQEIGDQWLTYGNDVGLKTTDLQGYQTVASPRLRVLCGACVGDNHFKALLAANGLSVESGYDFETEFTFPADLEAVNGQIVSLLPANRPVMVRSSALDERGGSGIYSSELFVTTGDQAENAARLRAAEDVVYSSFFSARASHSRETNGTDHLSGMGLLIQPIVGDEHDGHFMPALSGVLTTINGQPLLRLVMGLGTGAVEMSDAVVLQGTLDVDKAIKLLPSLQKVDAIDLAENEFTALPVSEEILEAARSQRDKLAVLLEEWQKGYDQGSPFYLEFALTESEPKPVILQAAPDEIKPSIPELGMPKGVVLCEGTDVVNTGEKNGRGIIWFGKDGQNPGDFNLIEDFNRRNKDFLIIVRDTAFSGVYGQEALFQMQHFSNAAGVVEVQYDRSDDFYMPGYSFRVDHTRSRGGAHFTEICKRKDILFLGYPMPKTGDHLQELLGRSTDRIGSFSAYWDVDFLMSTAVSGGRVELMGDVARPEYSPGEIRGWADEFWHHASDLEDEPQEDVRDAFYGVTYILAELSHGSLVGYNPLDISRLPQNPKEKAENIRDLNIVLANIDETESGIEYEMYMSRMGEEFRLKVFLERLLHELA